MSTMFSMMEACAIMCFNTRNLVFKDTCLDKFREKDMGDRWCLFLGCEGRDCYAHVRCECKYYTTKYRDTGYPVQDNAKFLVELDKMRQRGWKDSVGDDYHSWSHCIYHHDQGVNHGDVGVDDTKYFD